MGAVVQTQNNNPADVEEYKKAAFGLPFPILKWLVYRTLIHTIMLNSISYIEIGCEYNHIDLVLFINSFNEEAKRAIITYRNRNYYLSYDLARDVFYLLNSRDELVAEVCYGVFKFYVKNAPEIGLDLVWGLLAQLNLFPKKLY